MSLVATIAAAEKIRVAGRMTEEVATAMDGGDLFTSKDLTAAAHDASQCLVVLWGALSTLAGPEYRQSLQGPPDQSFRMMRHLAVIQTAAASMDGAELVAIMDESGFLYRDVARLAMEMRAALGFATPAELALIEQRKGEA